MRAICRYNWCHLSPLLCLRGKLNKSDSLNSNKQIINSIDYPKIGAESTKNIEINLSKNMEQKVTTNVTEKEKIETIESENVLANGVIFIRSTV